MSNTYGLPRKGSKNRIAERLIENFPPAENFYDLFLGGGAVTHACILRKGYKNYFVNDLDTGRAEFFVDCVNGRYHDRLTEWVGRERYKETWDKDIYTRTIWSYRSCGGSSYIYNSHIEELAHAHHLAALCGDYSLFDAMGIAIPRCTDADADTRVHAIERYIGANYKTVISKYTQWRESKGIRTNVTTGFDKRGRARWNLFNYCHHRRVCILEELPRIKGGRMPAIVPTSLDYRQIDIRPNSVVYCDIPYRGTSGYTGTGAFDHEAFYDWACSFDHRPDVTILISEYSMP